MKHLDLISYYMSIFGIERGPEWRSLNGFSVLMPTNREVEKRFTAFIKALGYGVIEESYWENHGFTNSPSHIHKFSCEDNLIIQNYVLSVSFEPIEGV